MTNLIKKLIKRSSSTSKLNSSYTSIPDYSSKSSVYDRESSDDIPSTPSSPISITSSFNHDVEYSYFSPSSSQGKLPVGWELRYDTILCEYYYVNESKNLVQFDSPLEVLQH